MTQRQQRIGAMKAALARFTPNTLSEHEERGILDTIVRNCARLGEGPLTWLFGSVHPINKVAEQPIALPVGELLACPRCGEKRFGSPAAVNGHLRTCKKGGEKWN
ncbi:hypothetical protein [Runella slithyformis]|uniref:Uncharacterized protein n=1 Tax=Runella slithyformis (strain ATCC 29530 / DSM 19594 / LMG 11500 / NCIMB 11436 / LSU 4) TaxID=761193 RepID=A0A7U3ZGF9_RUNSL|nr:hypothetical protein [Runella slithyformis]AEI46759.1 hypothetical protein Runsl_0307 [Runella slithyformis DSM 19594]